MGRIVTRQVRAIYKNVKRGGGGNPYGFYGEEIYDISMINKDLLDEISPYKRGVFLIVNKQIIPLLKEVTTLGRQLENDIVFHEEFLSRFHAEIVYEDGKYVLYDKQSTSGTSVNSRKVDRCVLNSGDLISLANIYIMFVDNNPKIAGKALGTTKSLHQAGLPAQKGQR